MVTRLQSLALAALTLALPADALAKSPRHAAWRGFGADCPLCTDAERDRASLPSPPSHNAIVYYVVGEFAAAPTLLMIDLDAGEISRVPFQIASGVKPKSASLNPQALNALREAAADAWRQRTHDRPTMIPGGAYLLELFSGGRALSLDPFDRRSKALVTAINQAAEPLRADRE